MPKKLDINTLESWLWECACKIRGEIDAPKYKDYILPLIFIKRLSDVFEDELIRISKDYNDDIKITEKLVKEDHSIVRFYIPKKARWEKIALQTTNVGQYLTDAVRSIGRENPKLHDVIVINKVKSRKQKDSVLLINASHLFKKGKPKNNLPDESIGQIAKIYLKWKETDGISKIIPKEEIVKNDYNLSPSRYVAQDGEDDTLPLEDAVVLLREAEEERAEADKKLKAVLKELGL